ncbi:MAG: hypothetical protein KDA75_05820, partial [Planctomycetaceae bacterium]|nr:hypothetical protein [Planctomycetaceae bacterium]
MPDQTWNDRRTNGKPLLLRLTVVCLYASLAIWSTWPLALDPLRKLPVGDDAIATVPLFNLWSVWWNADRAATGYRDYWNAPIFHPVPDAFAFSEPQPLTVMVAPFLWLTGYRVLAYNVYLWLSLGLNGVMAERLLRTMGVARCTAILGGCLMLLLPFVHWQREVLQLFPVWGLLWTLSELLKLLRRPSRWTGLQLGLALTASIFLCVHQTLLLLVVLAGAAWVSLDRWGEARWWSALLVAGAVSAGLAGPLLWKQWSVLESYAFARERAAVESLSAHPGDYRASAGRSWIPGETDSLRNGPPLGAGWLRSALAMVGLCIGVRRRRPRRAALLLGTIVVLAAGLSLGLNLAIGSWQPWQSLVAIVP